MKGTPQVVGNILLHMSFPRSDQRLLIAQKIKFKFFAPHSKHSTTWLHPITHFKQSVLPIDYISRICGMAHCISQGSPEK